MNLRTCLTIIFYITCFLYLSMVKCKYKICREQFFKQLSSETLDNEINLSLTE